MICGHEGTARLQRVLSFLLRLHNSRGRMWRDHYVGNVMNEMALAKPRYCKLTHVEYGKKDEEGVNDQSHDIGKRCKCEGHPEERLSKL